MDNNQNQEKLEFRGGMYMGLLPLVLLIIFCIVFFTILQVYESDVLALGALLCLIVGSFFSKNMIKYWDEAVKGVSNDTGCLVILILLIVGIFGQMMKAAGIGNGFVWLGMIMGLHGSMYCMFTFIFSGILATSTGTSLGTVLTLLPIMYPAGLVMGCNSIFLAGAIISGAMFGDGIGPISDTTITSSITQEYKNIKGSADVPGIVKSRAPYAFLAAAISCIMYAVLGGGNASEGSNLALMQEYADPKGLWMLLAMVALLVVAFKTRNLFLSASVGIIVGIVIALATGIFQPADILSIQDGDLDGFLINGVRGVLGTMCFLIALFAVIGVTQSSGVLDHIMGSLEASRLARSESGSELIIVLLGTVSCIMLGGHTSAAILFTAPAVNRLGQAHDIHPYRRANLLAGVSCALPTLIPFTLIPIMATGLINSMSNDFAFVDPINPIAMIPGVVFCYVSFFVYLFAVVTGWRRRYEGPDGLPKKNKAESRQG